MSESRYTGNRPYLKNVAFMLIAYWAILVVWQNIGAAETRGSADLILKCCLLVYFCFFYFIRFTMFHSKILIVLFFTFALVLTFVAKEDLTLSNVISYIYPILFMIAVYGIGDNFVINKHHLICFCNSVIVITMYAAIYALIFCWEQFSGALSFSNAYGNELSSFFISSHEYGLYLLSAIVSCFICLKLSTKITRLKKIWYLICICILTVNLILTFSRTSIFAFGIFLIIFILFEKGKLKRRIVACLILLIIVIAATPVLTDFIFKIVLKGNATAGRDVLYLASIEHFEDSDLFSKIFGSGITNSRWFFSDEFGHGSVHNGYLQILLYYGIVGLLALILFLISQIFASIKLIKKNRFIGTVCLGLVISASAIMFTNTMIIFTSPIDSYFLTIFMFIVPKYVRNAINQGVFEKETKCELISKDRYLRNKDTT